MFRTWHILVFFFALVVFAVALAPARPFLRQTEGALTYSRVEGTVWNAKVYDARVGGLDAGDVDAKVSPVDLLAGNLVVVADLQGPEIRGRVHVGLSLGGDFELRSPAMTISGAPLPGLGRLPGKTDIFDLVIGFADRRCRTAEGRLQSDALVETFADPQLGPGPQLSGAAACVGDTARLAMSGEQSDDALQTWLDLAGDGTGQWRLGVRTQEPRRAATLIAMGLAPQGEAGAFESRGMFRWLTF